MNNPCKLDCSNYGKELDYGDTYCSQCIHKPSFEGDYYVPKSVTECDGCRKGFPIENGFHVFGDDHMYFMICKERGDSHV